MVCSTVLFFFTTKKFLLSYFPNFHGQRSEGGGGGGGGGGARSQYFIPEAELFQPSRGFLQITYTQTVLLKMSCKISG